MLQYNPPRQTEKDAKDPIEIDLVYNVRSCGTCSFFWPKDPSKQPYGPFPAFDFDTNTPEGNKPDSPAVKSYPWIKGITRPQAFPNGEVMDGCRKAPIMTIGINPNLTAFAPGLQGTSWAYPNFTSDNGTDAYTKFAYYYRYRSVYQEHFNLDFVKQFLMEDGQIKAEKKGKLISATRTSQAPSYKIKIQYDGEEAQTIHLNRDLGTPRYVVLFNHYAPENEFEAGDIIAARLNVPGDKDVEIFQGQIGYYEQFVPVLSYFDEYLKQQGADDPNLKIGEDVAQLDMVACASPHWNEDYMGGQLETVVNNCVSKNAWAMKQWVQTKPAILFLVGESSYDMFKGAFPKLMHRNKPLSERPADGAFTLFSETIDSNDPTLFKFSTSINGVPYSLTTRIIVAPHFSYDANYVAQFRMSSDKWEEFKSTYASCYEYFKENDHQFKIVQPEQEGYYLAVQITSDVGGAFKELEANYADALKFLTYYYYNPHKQMAEVLEHLYENKVLTYTNAKDGQSGYLTRTEGSCHFCVNDHWDFPLGCPYGKTKLDPPAPGFLQEVAKQIVAAGK